MSGFSVGPDELVAAANGLRRAVDDVERFWVERDRWLELGRLVGSERVQRALAVFCESWAVPLRAASDDGELIADRLEVAALTYERVDGEVVAR